MLYKLVVTGTVKYILTRLLRVTDNKLFYKDFDKFNEAVYECSHCGYLHIGKYALFPICPCCSNQSIIFSMEDVSYCSEDSLNKFLN